MVYKLSLQWIRWINAKKNMKEILNNEFANVSYDIASNAIITVWKKPSTTDAYRLIFSAILNKIKEHKAEAFISDIFQQGMVGTENRLWIQNDILPKAYAAGLKKIALIAPNDVFSRFYVESVKNGVTEKEMNIGLQYFQDLISAQAWVLDQELAI